jgi:hypothetical protein
VVIFSKNKIGNEGARLCGEMLRLNNTLQYLYVGYVWISKLTGLMESLATNESICLLSLESNFFNISNVPDVCKIIQQNKSLTYLDLENMPLSVAAS